MRIAAPLLRVADDMLAHGAVDAIQMINLKLLSEIKLLQVKQVLAMQPIRTCFAWRLHDKSGLPLASPPAKFPAVLPSYLFILLQLNAKCSPSPSPLPSALLAQCRPIPLCRQPSCIALPEHAGVAAAI